MVFPSPLSGQTTNSTSFFPEGKVAYLWFSLRKYLSLDIQRDDEKRTQPRVAGTTATAVVAIAWFAVIAFSFLLNWCPVDQAHVKDFVIMNTSQDIVSGILVQYTMLLRFQLALQYFI